MITQGPCPCLYFLILLSLGNFWVSTMDATTRGAKGAEATPYNEAVTHAECTRRTK